MSELRDLYQEVILEHARKPRNFRAIEGPAAQRAEGYNPLCGDKVSVSLELGNGLLKDVAFEGAGCAISTASASVMTELLKGRTPAEAEALFRTMHDLVTGHPEAITDAEELGKLAVFAGVSEFPARVKCASLAWHVMRAALAREPGMVTTE